ncbi:MAG: type IV toxin-antitoxin system AbiEi family antitoxin [Gammaproteobacteria bacterium]
MKVQKPKTLEAFVDTLESKGIYYFLRKDAISSIGFSKVAFNSAAQRLSKNKRIKQIRGDFYIILPLAYQNIGTLPGSWFIDDFMKHENVPYYISILTAAAIHGASHQQPTVFQVVANKQMRPITVGKLNIQFHYNKYAFHIPTISKKTETGYIKVATPEVTICDCLRYISFSGQINNVANILIELSKVINMEKLTQFLINSKYELVIAQRLGYLIQKLKLNLPVEKLINFINERKPKYRLLVNQSDINIIERDKKWKILVNELVEPDI